MRHPTRCDPGLAAPRIAMTPVSDRGLGEFPRACPNPAVALAEPCVARALHDRSGLRALAFILGSCLVGCILPPSLSVDVQDAGIDSPPSITAVRSASQELPEGAIAQFAFGQMDMINLTLLDTDVTDTLYVRIFVNYKPDDPTPARSFCQSAAGMSAFRTATCDTQALCQQGEVGNLTPLLMRIVVFDRQVLDSGSPAFMAMPVGGQSTSRVYSLFCTPPSL
jgi:hypothetical protein